MKKTKKVKNTKNTSKIAHSFKKKLPSILTGLGIVGMSVTAIVVGADSTPKALTCIEKKKVELNKDKLTVAETVKATWKCYIVPAITYTASVACLVSANSMNVKRNAALTAAYLLSETNRKEYQDWNKKIIGDKKEQSVRDAIAKDHVDKHPVSNNEIITTKKGDTLCLDYISGRLFRSDMETIRKIVNNLNYRMRNEMYISLNDFYYEMNLPSIGIGDDLGWKIDDGFIDPEFSTQLTDDGQPCLVIKYSVAPKYEYNKNK